MNVRVYVPGAGKVTVAYAWVEESDLADFPRSDRTYPLNPKRPHGTRPTTFAKREKPLDIARPAVGEFTLNYDQAVAIARSWARQAAVDLRERVERLESYADLGPNARSAAAMERNIRTAERGHEVLVFTKDGLRPDHDV